MISFTVRGVDLLTDDLDRARRARIGAEIAEASAEALAGDATRRLKQAGRLGRRVAQRRGIRAEGPRVVLAGGRDVLGTVAALEHGAKRERYRFSGRYVGGGRTARLGGRVPGFFVGAAATKAGRVFDAAGGRLSEITDGMFD